MRFLPAIIRGMEELCRQKPWSIPAHDRDLRNYNGTDYYVDLVVATAGNTFAQCVRLLDDRLPIETRALVNCAFREKVFRPIRRCLEETKPVLLVYGEEQLEFCLPGRGDRSSTGFAS